MSDVVNGLESKMRKIKKLFALAGNNPNREEAEAALLMAQRLLLDNGLDMADIHPFSESNPDQDKGKVDTATINKKQNVVKSWQIRLMHSVAPNFRCKFLITSVYRGHGLMLYGRPIDVQVCKETVEFAFSSFERLWSIYHKELIQRGKAGNGRENRFLTAGLKNDYALGFAKGIADKYTEQVQTRALTIVIDDAVIKRVKEDSGSSYHSSFSIVSRNDEARQRGYQDGKSTK